MVSRTRGRPNKSGVSAIPDAVLLSLVLQAFGENGFDGTSIREIARQLNVSGLPR
jgi:TetR/AcrR family transcriptional regulator